MHIAFDVLPLIGCRMTGIGYCEAGQIQALSKMYPDDEFLLQFFSRKNEEIKIQRLQPYLRENVQPHWAKASGYVYRLVSNFLPISYRHYFGDKAEVTHFFNYIVPPKVAGKTVVTVHDHGVQDVSGNGSRQNAVYAGYRTEKIHEACHPHCDGFGIFQAGDHSLFPAVCGQDSGGILRREHRTLPPCGRMRKRYRRSGTNTALIGNISSIWVPWSRERIWNG